MHLSIPAGSTSKIIQIPIFDSSSTTGALLTGLVFNTASLTAYYNREGAAGAATAITLATATKGTWATGGFIAVDGTNTPGWYELHIPDAALAAGAKSVIIHLKGATNMVPVPILVELTAISNQDAVRGGMTALPNANAEAAGGLYTRGTGAGQIAQDANGNIRANVDTIKTQTVTCAAGVTVLASVGTAATSTAQTGDAFARLGAPAGASVSADVAAIQADTNDIQTRIPAALVGGRIDASVGAMAAGVVTAAAIATDAIDNDAIAADVTAVIADAVWNAATITYGAAGSYGLLVETNLDAAVSTRSTYAGGAVASVTGAVGSVTGLTAADVGAIKAKTDSLTFTVAGQVDANIQSINDVAITGNGGVTPFNV